MNDGEKLCQECRMRVLELAVACVIEGGNSARDEVVSTYEEFEDIVLGKEVNYEGQHQRAKEEILGMLVEDSQFREEVVQLIAAIERGEKE